jgi:hypothetical protein
LLRRLAGERGEHHGVSLAKQLGSRARYGGRCDDLFLAAAATLVRDHSASYRRRGDRSEGGSPKHSPLAAFEDWAGIDLSWVPRAVRCQFTDRALRGGAGKVPNASQVPLPSTPVTREWVEGMFR